MVDVENLDYSIREISKPTFDRWNHVARLEVDSLQIDQTESLFTMHYKTLGDLIQLSVQLKQLYIRVPFVKGSEALLAGLANAVGMKELSLVDPHEYTVYKT